MKRLLYRMMTAGGSDHAVWRLLRGRLRILCYHGVCEDHLAGAPWMPRFFVSRSAFASQLAYLRRHTYVISLAEGCERLAQNDLPPRAVSITFDDGYANNLDVALPLLEKHGLPATVFLSSAYIESGDWYPFLQTKLIHLSRPQARLPEYKSSPIDVVIEAVRAEWTAVFSKLSADQRRSLRPLTIGEVRSMCGGPVTFGAHTHTHCILANEHPQRRLDEITTSLRRVREWTGETAPIFSYPNGQRGDYGTFDMDALRAEGVRWAVCGVSGANSAATDPLELKRYPLGIFHDDLVFRAELMGARSALLAGRGRI